MGACTLYVSVREEFLTCFTVMLLDYPLEDESVLIQLSKEVLSQGDVLFRAGFVEDVERYS